ncbi:glutaredoxin-C9-like [Impatiens glandulifera]|uniref:glutaredoxin-C9-like n=1 Tax=Impatiens glandulifera TaxID=253017 RepID=UPI001FB10728|nr:glutaredoxin-C9-like [Impatiens glandulifera]
MSKLTIPIPIPKDDYHVMKNMISQNAVTIVGMRDCCMVHVVEHLIHGFGARLTTYNIDEEDKMNALDQLGRIINGVGEDKVSYKQLPLVFIGGRLFGGVDRVISSHVRAELIPALKEVGAMWV